VSWPTAKLDELGTVGRGRSRHRPRNDPSLYGGDIPFVQTAEIANANYYIESYKQTYNQKGLDQSKIWTNETLCMTIAGENTARTAVLNFPACFPDSIVGFVPDPDKADLRYIKHALDILKDSFRSISKGATQDNLSLSKILSFDIPVPPVPYQQRISEILSAYDDLIENNRRRIALLEEAARQLYKEWFVRFRFPGHEHVKIIDGVPENWERTPASNVLNVLSGGTPKTTTAQFWGGDIGFFTPKDAVQGCYVAATEKMITEEGLARCNSKLYPKDTLFITARGTVGKMNLAMVPMAMNQSCYALKSKCGMSQRLLYLTMDVSLQQLRSQASGAVFDAIIVATFDRIFVTKPEKHIADEFDDTVNPVFDQIANLERQIDHLAKARDLLLPKLMSGAIPV